MLNKCLGAEGKKELRMASTLPHPHPPSLLFQVFIFIWNPGLPGLVDSQVKYRRNLLCTGHVSLPMISFGKYLINT